MGFVSLGDVKGMTYNFTFTFISFIIIYYYFFSRYKEMSEAILFLNGSINLSFCEKYIRDILNNYDIFCADGDFFSEVSKTSKKNRKLGVGKKNSKKRSKKSLKNSKVLIRV